MDISDFEKLLETRAQRELNDAETRRLEAWFAEHPEDREIWDEETALSGVLADLTDVPVSSNFTARVWQQIEMDSREPERTENTVVRFLTGSWLRIPRIAWACALILAFGISLQQQHTQTRDKVAQSIVPVVELAQLPSVEILQDFDAINSLSEPMISGDLELLAALEEGNQ
jgi:hypothetical protein